MMEEIPENHASKEMQSDKCIFISAPAWNVKDTQYVADGFRLVST